MEKHEIDKYFNSRRISEKIANLILKKGEIDKDDELDDFLNNDKNFRYLVEFVRRSETVADIDEEIGNRDKDHDIRKLYSRITNKKRSRKKYATAISLSVIVVAAAVVISFLFYIPKHSVKPATPNEKIVAVADNTVKLLLSNGQVEILNENKIIDINGTGIAKNENKTLKYQEIDGDTAVWSTLIVPKQCRHTVQLEDGTVIYLSSNTTLHYPSKFSGNNREVELIGEAYFKVKKGSRPFEVKSSGVVVRVYGTEFNIDAYDSQKITTTLLKGSVGVKYNVDGKEKEFEIKPSQRFTVNPQTGDTRIESHINISRYPAWLDGTFRCDEEPLENLLDAISKWYGVKFIYLNQEIRNKSITAYLDSSMSIDDLLELLKISSKINVVKKGGIYMVE